MPVCIFMSASTVRSLTIFLDVAIASARLETSPRCYCSVVYEVHSTEDTLSATHLSLYLSDTHTDTDKERDTDTYAEGSVGRDASFQCWPKSVAKNSKAQTVKSFCDSLLVYVYVTCVCGCVYLSCPQVTRLFLCFDKLFACSAVFVCVCGGACVCVCTSGQVKAGQVDVGRCEFIFWVMSPKEGCRCCCCSYFGSTGVL